MGKLTNVRVWRGGLMSRYLYEEPGSVSCEGHKLSRRLGVPCVTINHCLASKGGGITDVYIDIGKEAFEALMLEMLKADREAALTAFASASR